MTDGISGKDLEHTTNGKRQVLERIAFEMINGSSFGKAVADIPIYFHAVRQ